MLELCQVALANRLLSLDLQVKAGECLHLLGPNGAGKSSLLGVMSGLLLPDAGEIRWQQQPLSRWELTALARQRCYQQQSQDTAFALSAGESIRFFSEQRSIPDTMEAALEVKGLLDRPLSRLSGGEQRRIQLVRSLLPCWAAIEQGKALILLDEPIQGLDLRHQHLLMQWLSCLAERGNRLVVSHHDLNMCWQYATRVCLLNQGRLVFSGKLADITTTGLFEQVFQCSVQVFSNSQGQQCLQTYLRRDL